VRNGASFGELLLCRWLIAALIDVFLMCDWIYMMSRLDPFREGGCELYFCVGAVFSVVTVLHISMILRNNRLNALCHSWPQPALSSSIFTLDLRVIMLVPQPITAMRAAGTTVGAPTIETLGTEAEKATRAATIITKNTPREILVPTTIKETTVKMVLAITEIILRETLVPTVTEPTTILANEDCIPQTTLPGHRGIETPGTTHRRIGIPITAVMPITVAVMMVETTGTRRVRGRQSTPQGMIDTILQGRGIRLVTKIPEDPIIPTTTVTLGMTPRGQGPSKIPALIT
jgi:hypothetical protein